MEQDFFFPPYIGVKYADDDNFFNGKKVLVIGHAHYCTDGYPKKPNGRYDRKLGCGINCPNYAKDRICPNRTGSWTDDVVKAYINYKKFQLRIKNVGEIEDRKTFSNFANLFIPEKRRNPENHIRLWESVIFYNFTQSASPKTTGKDIPKVYDDAKPYFLLLLDNLKDSNILPDIIIVWGEYIPPHLPFYKDISWANKIEKSGFIIFNEKTIPLAFIKHPMLGYYDHNTKVIKSVAPELFPTNI